MINDIIDGISIKLHDLFGDSIEIYYESIKQGFQEPCFFIKTLEGNKKNFIAGRYFRNNPFDIHYFPGTSEKNKEMIDVLEQLYLNMEFISLVNGDELYGHGLKHNIVDDVLHFFASYDMFVKNNKVVDNDMQNVNIVQSTKG